VTEKIDVEPITVDLDALGLGPEDPDEQKAAAESVHRKRKRRLQEALETVASAQTQAMAVLTVLGVAGTTRVPSEPIEGSSAPEDEPGPGDTGPSFTESRFDEPDAIITKPSSKERHGD
jgi:hypothetical protein